MGHAVVATAYDRCQYRYDVGVSDRLRCKLVDGLEHLGLQRLAGKRPGTDMPEVLRAMAAGKPSRDYVG